ncbi:glutamyl-tRNA reductase [Stratiformator vulcanicus]|uniref:Glutamyl-tRNA reductase n=1 Tax=Stratiformator vulcanicus TaxID=2527980 RepID=A0A517R2D6_9PLAN|nr:glutamyl-tRNA reductase [Stratiformator vulcanicus]QDT38021.1 Glutamyl-tRNA reductase [Stratiformator vulcanicus]
MERQNVPAKSPSLGEMNFNVVYCNHQSADLEVRERLTLSTEDQFQRAYEALLSRFPGSEMVVLSTCNRVEVYSAEPDGRQTPRQSDVAEFLSDFHQIPVKEFADDLLEHRGPQAVRHLFEVACSLDSMVLGEPQIINQVKQAYERAFHFEACGPLTHTLFQMAFRVSARVRTETRLAEGRVSIASVAVGEFGRNIFSRFDDKRILVIGAGEMAEETVRYLNDEGAREVTVVNRSLDRGSALAQSVGGKVRPYEELDECLQTADIIVSATGADYAIIDYERFARLRASSDRRTMFILDLGTPRDFDPRIAAIDDNVFLYDVDDLKATCDRNRRLRHKEIEKAHRIIEAETEQFMHEVYHRATGPVVKRLREQWHDIRQQEVDLLLSKLSHLGEEDQAAIERTIERIVNKLLHPPLEALKAEARVGPPTGLMEALKRLFHLSDSAD